MNNTRGILLMITAMVGFTLEDLFIKKLSVTWPISQILLVLGLSGALVFALTATFQGQRIFASNAWRKTTMARAGSEAAAGLLF